MPDNSNRIIRYFNFEGKTSFGMSRLFSGLRRASWKSSVSCCNKKVGQGEEEKNNFLCDLLWILIILKVKIKFVLTFYFISFWLVQLEAQHTEFLCFWYVFREFPAWKMEVRKLTSQYMLFWIYIHAWVNQILSTGFLSRDIYHTF